MDGSFTVEDFGRQLRQRRKELGMSQEAFAHHVGLDRTYIGGIERGERNPSLTTILRIASALNADPASLFQAVRSDR